ncbi:hypothetical protein BCR33DRAFT_722167 [Rhizoclosmatium globosum]|uniref:U1-type domain-containing protein n=1 Tax=Rhizoclosmatium globosum TaxID=329046 RepID=A0A1Y2BNN8_9FUNG|nr:hypothetical protein BCR33DRAFT_722167 [Rhizoclosmatium globosum]|eukprot:ORY36363.1 hypothetical protein BCR33DRAFT_722167 [Rhizoclosmatium globosum]
MSTGKKGFYDGAAPGGDTGFRRTWDKDEYAKKAREREENARTGGKNHQQQKDKEANKEPEKLLTQRDAVIDFAAAVNKTHLVQATGAGPEQPQPGFYCAACNIVCKDNVNYLDHLNGYKHLKNVGSSTKVERSTADQVKARLEALTKKRKEPEAEFNLAARVKSAKDAEEEAKKAKKEEKKRKKEEKSKKEESTAIAEFGGMDPDMAAMMGFGGFGSSKK